MKKCIFLSIILVSILTSGCCSNKMNEAKTNTANPSLYDITWELEYISGPRIGFNGLYPEQKPTITFTAADNQFGGNNSCNVYSGKYTIKDASITFGDAMKTMRFCEGGGEETFMKILGKVTKFSFDNEGKLLLLTDAIPMMRFKKSNKVQ
ncbi:META domain-containing protein [Flavobacterium sp. 25HG05S-40]|uniref:META domain-containing protein n=1 Tax=Flavobacterium sp. 25HG05S-40 TaxID=3458682 RepID=UPI0040450D4D